MEHSARDKEKLRTAMTVVDSKERIPRPAVFVQLKLGGVGVFHT